MYYANGSVLTALFIILDADIKAYIVPVNILIFKNP